jgi:hypothetical protein
VHPAVLLSAWTLSMMMTGSRLRLLSLPLLQVIPPTRQAQPIRTLMPTLVLARQRARARPPGSVPAPRCSRAWTLQLLQPAVMMM